MLMRLQTRGVNQVDPGEAERRRGRAATASSPTASTPPPTWRPRSALDGHWVDVENPEMDCGLVVDGDGGRPRVRTLPMSDVAGRA